MSSVLSRLTSGFRFPISAFPISVVAAAGILLVPGGTFARGPGGFAAAAHGPVFGLHARGPFRLTLVRRFPARFGFNLRGRHLHARNRAAGAIYPPLDAGYAPEPSDLTGTLPAPGPAVFVPPVPPSPPEQVGCLARGYEVASESGGIAHVTVIRC